MFIPRHRPLPRKQLRKSSNIREKVKPSSRRKLGLSEGALTKAKLILGILIAIVALASGLLTLLKIYASDETTFKKYADRAVAWHYKTEMWNGYFSNWFEGIVNIAELNLSDTSMTLTMQASGNAIDGAMSEKRLCAIFPPQDFKLVRGTISHFGNTADIQIYEFVQGHTKVYAEFTLRHDGLVLEVEPKRNSRWFGRDTVRLIHHPQSNIDTGFEVMKGICKQEEAQYRKLLKERFEELVKKGLLKQRPSSGNPPSSASAPLP